MIKYEDEWNDKIMSGVWIASMIIPLIGIIVGIITSIIKNKRQGLSLIIISICFTILNIIIPVFGSAFLGIFMLVIVWKKPNPICPCCEKIFPRFTGKLKNKFLKGGWICPECGCNIDRNGKKETTNNKQTSIISQNENELQNQWNFPTSSNDEDYVKRCLEAEFEDEIEVRNFRSDPDFATVLTPLNSKEYDTAIKAGKQILPKFSDFDLVYTWLASAYRETKQLQNSRDILNEGLRKAKRSYFILTEMGETEWQSGNIDAALYWWSQALHCLSNNPIDYNAYLLLSYVAKGAGTEDVEKVLLARVDAMRGGQIRLDSQTAERLTTLVKSKKSEAMKKVLYGLYNKYFTVKLLHDEEVVIPKAKVELFGTKKQDVGVTTTSLSLTDDIAKSLAVLDEAYLARYDEQLEKHVNDALDNISSKGEVGIKTLLDRLYRDINIVGSVLHAKSFGEMDHNEWLKRQTIVDALGRAHATSAIPRLLALQTAQSSVKQFYDILLPAVKRALGQLGDTPQQDKPITKKCPYCDEEIHRDAIKCKYCREWLNKETKELQPLSPTKAKQGKSVDQSSLQPKPSVPSTPSFKLSYGKFGFLKNFYMKAILAGGLTAVILIQIFIFISPDMARNSLLIILFSIIIFGGIIAGILSPVKAWMKGAGAGIICFLITIIYSLLFKMNNIEMFSNLYFVKGLIYLITIFFIFGAMGGYVGGKIKDNYKGAPKPPPATMESGQIQSLLKSPISTASYARFKEATGDDLTMFNVHEDMPHVKNLPKEVSIDVRNTLFTCSGVGIITVILRIEGEIYETWWNFHNPLFKQCFYDMSKQEKLLVSFYVDNIKPVRTIWTPNILREGFSKIINTLQEMPPWTMQAFDTAKEELYREYATPTDLWNSLNKSHSEITVSDKSSDSTPAEEAIDRQASTWRQKGFAVGGVEAAKETVSKVSASRPDEVWFEEAVNRIVSIYREHPQGFVQGMGGAQEQELRQIGEMLDQKGKIDLMRTAHANFASKCDIRGASRNLEIIWDGIGNWRG